MSSHFKKWPQLSATTTLLGPQPSAWRRDPPPARRLHLAEGLADAHARAHTHTHTHNLHLHPPHTHPTHIHPHTHTHPTCFQGGRSCLHLGSRVCCLGRKPALKVGAGRWVTPLFTCSGGSHQSMRPEKEPREDGAGGGGRLPCYS